MSTVIISKIKHPQDFNKLSPWGCYIDNELVFFDHSLDDLVALIAGANLPSGTVLEVPQNWAERAKGLKDVLLCKTKPIKTKL